MLQKKKVTKIGYLLLISFLVFSVIAWGYTILGLPFYLLGVFLIWKSDLRRNVKLNWCLIPLLPFAIQMFVATKKVIKYSNKRKVEIQRRDESIRTAMEYRFILNEESNLSSLILVFNSRCAESSSSDAEGVQEYEVPSDGILFIGDSINFYNKFNFYSKGYNGGIRKIEYRSSENADSSRPFITGSKVRYQDLSPLRKPSKIRFLSFALFDPQNNRTTQESETREEFMFRLKDKIIHCE